MKITKRCVGLVVRNTVTFVQARPLWTSEPVAKAANLSEDQRRKSAHEYVELEVVGTFGEAIEQRPPATRVPKANERTKRM